jgi:short-subunit dehydrogenase
MAESTTARTVLVTGASAGIGEAFARVFAEHGWGVVVTARRGDRLEALAGELRARHGVRVHVVAQDLARHDASAHILRDVERAGMTIDALVNNAGYGVPGTYRHTTWRQQAEFLQVMVTAVCELSHRVLPGMVARRYGRILNVSSMLGLLPGIGGLTLYGAAKAFLVRFSQSLALEVRGHGVHVTAVCPGFTRSEFHDVSGTTAAVSRLPGIMWTEADVVARAGYDASMAGEVVCIPGAVNRGLATLAGLLPDSLVQHVLGGANPRAPGRE